MKKTLFLLGAHGGIGAAIADKFAAHGYEIIAPHSKELDLAVPESISGYFYSRNIKAHAFISSAGINIPKPLETVTQQDIDHTAAVNVNGVFAVLKYLLPGFKEENNGHILMISSLYSFLSRANRLPYAMSKHALDALVKTAALELGSSNIKVNALSPGFVDTKMTRKNNDPSIIRTFEERIPLQRLALPGEIANVAFFLCSPENSYITGQNIIVDGGYSVGGFQR
jgi:3-oxoacyl-[acyl-carrier protein] reductase